MNVNVFNFLQHIYVFTLIQKVSHDTIVFVGNGRAFGHLYNKSDISVIEDFLMPVCTAF